jgi:hypothetical protein
VSDSLPKSGNESPRKRGGIQSPSAWARCLEIELEENTRRKDLTSLELSENLVQLAEVAAEVLASDLLPNLGNKSSRGRGRPKKTDSEEKVAERIGVPRQTIALAKQPSRRRQAIMVNREYYGEASGWRRAHRARVRREWLYVGLEEGGDSC